MLQFSGARRPLWVVRKDTAAIEVITGDRNCLCETTKGDHTFSSQEIQLNDGDTVYVFSDGFADSFDETGKHKLKITGFKKLLLEIKDQSMPEQHDSLNNFLNTYIGTGRQTDDILLVAVRYKAENN